jgi:pimeloyl-ACP methyl ester carboxylesterase
MLRVSGDGVTLAVNVEGEGHPVLLLHGFPDSSFLWRNQVPALVEAGLQVIAPDLRGFGESDRPEAVQDYAISRSMADVKALLDELGLERAHVVGHDFGAGLAWALAALNPDRVNHLVVMSVGHPNLLRSPSIEQRQRFWYQLLFQFEGVAESMLMGDDWSLFRQWLSGAGDLERYITDLSRPGALTAGLNWYRANSAPHLELGRTRPFPPAAVPTLGMWSTGDEYLVEGSMMRSYDHVTASWRYERVEGASHWMQLDEPGLINDLLVEFLVTNPRE